MAKTHVHNKLAPSGVPEALVALVRLLARQAARDAFATNEDAEASTPRKDTQPIEEN